MTSNDILKIDENEELAESISKIQESAQEIKDYMDKLFSDYAYKREDVLRHLKANKVQQETIYENLLNLENSILDLKADFPDVIKFNPQIPWKTYADVSAEIGKDSFRIEDLFDIDEFFDIDGYFGEYFIEEINLPPSITNPKNTKSYVQYDDPTKPTMTGVSHFDLTNFIIKEDPSPLTKNSLESMKYHDFYYFKLINENAKEIFDFTAGFHQEEFLLDKKTQKAVARNLQIIGVYGSELLKFGFSSFKKDYPTLPWEQWEHQWKDWEGLAKINEVNYQTIWDDICNGDLQNIVNAFDTIEPTDDFIPPEKSLI